MIINELNSFTKLVLKAASFVAIEIFGKDWKVELNNINFAMDYVDLEDPNNEEQEPSLIYIDGNLFTSDSKSCKKFEVCLYNEKEFELDNIQFLKGIFFGYFSALDENN